MGTRSFFHVCEPLPGEKRRDGAQKELEGSAELPGGQLKASSLVERAGNSQGKYTSHAVVGRVWRERRERGRKEVGQGRGREKERCWRSEEPHV